MLLVFTLTYYLKKYVSLGYWINTFLYLYHPYRCLLPLSIRIIISGHFSMATNSSCTTSPPIATSDSTTISDCTIVTPSRVKCKTYTVKMKLEAVKFGMLNSKADAARKYNVEPARRNV